MYSKFNNFSEALVGLACLIREEGRPMDSRAGFTKELIGNVVEIENPRLRHLRVLNRNENPLAGMIETLWVLSGRNDIATLLPYLPRAADFSDDGVVWRAGYGPRVVPQIPGLIDSLRSSGYGFIQIFQPELDHGTVTKDVPCNNLLEFFVTSDGRLDLAVSVRSNDLVWGFSGINTLEWSVLHEVIAESLGISMGKQVWHQTSLHMYNPYIERSENYELLPVGSELKVPTGISPDLKEASQALDQIKRFESGLDLGVTFNMDTLLEVWLSYFQYYWSRVHGIPRPLPEIPLESNTALALEGYFQRKFKDGNV